MGDLGEIDDDLTCGGCDYNLRGLAAGGACPECGHDVGATLRGVSSRRAAWLRRVSRGALLIGAGILVGGAGAAALVPWGQRPLLFGFPGGAVVAAVGTWLFATAAPRGWAWDDRAFGLVLRALGVATCAMQLYVALLLAYASGRVAVPVALPVRFTTVCEAAAAVWAVTAAATCVRAAMLAARLRDPAGQVQAVAIGVVSAGALAWGAAEWDTFGIGTRLAYLIVIGVASGWAVVFFVGFSVVLRRRARAAAGGEAMGEAGTQ